MLTSAQLADALLDGKHSGFTVMPERWPMLEEEDVVTASDPACQSLADVTSVKPKHQLTGTVWAVLQDKNGNSGGSIVLSSFATGGAKDWMSELKAALTTCKNFSASSRRGWSDPVTLAALPAADVGDGSVSYSVTADETSAKRQIMTIVRTGGSLAVYLTPSDGQRPPVSLMKRQHEQLEAAG
ncbi:hypothetical protein ACFVX6_15830 [Streptomyces sp. NPDC058289]|uniref:hypothetical protein n=1 Tax=Streptomyces sp. NPDC058289 TaxID=3346425 RepID=UPI0036EA3EFC